MSVYKFEMKVFQSEPQKWASPPFCRAPLRCRCAPCDNLNRGHVHFISCSSGCSCSAQFEVFEVKQISGDINLISFCSGFCFMVLWVQVPVGGGGGGVAVGSMAVSRLANWALQWFSFLGRPRRPSLSSARCYKWFWLVERRHLVLI